MENGTAKPDEKEFESEDKEQSREVIVTQQSPINMMEMIDDRDIEIIAMKAEKHAKIEKRLRQIAISVTNKNDWVDEGGKPYLMWSGASRVARILGISYFDLSESEQTITDDKGEYIISKIKGKIKWKGDIIEEIGTSHSRKPLVAMRKDKKTGQTVLLPLSEIDRTNITKMAHTNFLNRGLKSMVGLNFTWEEVQDATGATPGDSGGNVGFKKTEKNLNDPRRKEIGDMLVELHGESASLTLQAFTTFKTSNGETVQGKKKVSELTDKQVEHTHKKVLDQFTTKYKCGPVEYFKKKNAFLNDKEKK